MADCEKINPYGPADTRDKGQQVRDMFDSIAPAYDFMNRAMTFGIDRCWRRIAVRKVARTSPKRILDVASGTGDLAMALARRIADAAVVGIDLSDGMLDVARRKVAESMPGAAITFERANCLSLPMGADSFDAVTVAYGVRNFSDLLRGYKEMFRVLRPGGMLCVIELSTPQSPLVSPFYNFYTRHIIPFVGRLASHDLRAYSYLPESIAAVPQGADMLRLMEQAGFGDTAVDTLTFGVCSIYTARKLNN